MNFSSNNRHSKKQKTDKKQNFIINRQLLYDDETPIRNSNIADVLKNRETNTRRIMTTVPSRPIILGRLGIDGSNMSLNTLTFPFC
jgi:hypothetical protein